MKSCHQVTPSSPLRHPDTAPDPNAPPHCTLAKSGHISTEAPDLQQSPPSNPYADMEANFGEFADVVTARIDFASSAITVAPPRHRDIADNNLKREDQRRMSFEWMSLMVKEVF
ncbi:hypothetical protein RIF29_40210 [Crotalaria pallida]|uniref:Uncharacterized protein n=1 Tax=Crotalaria pallida TaxID=3830 RepID=A0AAN9HN98_CROPI